MNELLTKLGIDWKLLLAQIVNFIILIWLLRRFAYRPLLAMLERRQHTISKSIEDAKKIEEERNRLTADRTRVINEARREATAILDRARTNSDAFLASTRERAQVEAAEITSSAREKAARMKDSVVAQARGELADLIVAGAEKIIRIKLDPNTDQRLIEEALTERGQEARGKV